MRERVVLILGSKLAVIAGAVLLLSGDSPHHGRIVSGPIWWIDVVILALALGAASRSALWFTARERGRGG